MIVDTSVWIDYFNGHESWQTDRLDTAIDGGEPIRLIGLIRTEILFGLRTEREAARIAELLDAFDWVDEPIRADYDEAARLYRLCRGKGATIRSTVDCLIARLCLRDDLPLLTKDRDFDPIAKHAGLLLVDAAD